MSLDLTLSNNHEKITLKNTVKTEMSSPGWVKDHRQTQPLTEDYNTPVTEMETNFILKSTLWVKSVVSVGLPMNFFDNPEVHKTVLMTGESGQNYIRTTPGGVKEPSLSHHTSFTKLIPKLDHLIDDKTMGKMREMTRDLVTTVFSDGLLPWDIKIISVR